MLVNASEEALGEPSGRAMIAADARPLADVEPALVGEPGIGHASTAGEAADVERTFSNGQTSV